MDKRRLSLALLALLLPAAAQADRHKIGGRGAFVDSRRSNLWGYGQSFDFPLVLKRSELAPQGRGESQTLSAVVELGVAWGDHEGEDLTQFTYLSGLRYSFNHVLGKCELYGQGLVGGFHANQGDVRDVSMLALGVGVYVPFGTERLGASLQVDRYFPQSSLEAFTQISLGLVFRVPKH